MSRMERKHERIGNSLTPEYLKRMSEEGWRLAAVTWERQLPAGTETPHLDSTIPFGLRVAEDCGGLTEDDFERETLLAMLELVSQDRPLTDIALELNRRGSRTRTGNPWNAGSVFEMMPRLIEVGSQVFASDGWAERRKRLFPA